LTVPKEVWRLVDALAQGGDNGVGNAMKEKDLFVDGLADADQVAAIRESLDCNTPLPICTPHALAQALVTLLASLPRPLLPVDIYPTAAVEPTSLRLYCKRLLDQLPPINYALFVYLLTFFQAVLAQGEYNRTTPSRLAAVLIGCVLPDPLEGEGEERGRREASQQYMQPVLECLLASQSGNNPQGKGAL
jgi:phosphatidylinositol-bisphosphatase